MIKYSWIIIVTLCYLTHWKKGLTATVDEYHNNTNKSKHDQAEIEEQSKEVSRNVNTK